MWAVGVCIICGIRKRIKQIKINWGISDIMKIHVIAEHTSLPNEAGYNRFRYLCDILAKEGHEVTLVTSRFNHYNKSFRNLSVENSNYKIVLLNELGYKKNTSIKRIMSQVVFAQNLKKYLKKVNERPDIMYFSVPTHEPVLASSNYMKLNKIQCIIDVQDLWPEAMKLLFNIPVLSNLLFLPIKLQANKVYSMADKIIAVSREYMERAMINNKKSTVNDYVYIGTFMSEFDKGMKENQDLIIKDNNEFWVVYIGTLGLSYDIKTLIFAYKLLIDRGLKNVKLKILGRGPSEQELQQYANKVNVNVDFLGYKEYGEMAAYLSKSDVAINAIKKNAAQSIINKVGDYFSAGLPVLNGSLCKEMKQLIDDHKCGINYEPENAFDLAEKIEELYLDKHKRETMGANSRSLAELKFNREETYKKILDIIK